LPSDDPCGEFHQSVMVGVYTSGIRQRFTAQQEQHAVLTLRIFSPIPGTLAAPKNYAGQFTPQVDENTRKNTPFYSDAPPRHRVVPAVYSPLSRLFPLREIVRRHNFPPFLECPHQRGITPDKSPIYPASTFRSAFLTLSTNPDMTNERGLPGNGN
jgi:hypothetical protein